MASMTAAAEPAPLDTLKPIIHPGYVPYFTERTGFAAVQASKIARDMGCSPVVPMHATLLEFINHMKQHGLEGMTKHRGYGLLEEDK